MKSILVTGASGTIGRHLVPKLRTKNQRVHTMSRYALGEFHFTHDITEENFSEIIRDCKADTVIHLAGNVSVTSSWDDPLGDLVSNAVGTLRLLLSIKDTCVQNLVYVNSGGAIYGNNFRTQKESHESIPNSPYGASKLIAENYIKIFAENYGISWTSLAVSNVFGPYETTRKGVIYDFLKAFVEKKPAVIFGLNTTRDFVHISDVVHAITMVVRNPTNCRINICSGIETNLIELYKFMQGLSPYSVPFEVLDLPKGHVSRNQLDNTLAKDRVGWVPRVNLESWLRDEIKRLVQP